VIVFLETESKFIWSW